MNQVSLPEETSVTTPSPPIADTRLSGTRLLLARGVWIMLMLLFCGFYLTALLVYYVQFHGLQEGVYAHLISTSAVVSGFDAIEFLYLPLTSPYATLLITLLTLLSPFWIVTSLVIFWRRSDDWMALFVSLFLVMLATNISPTISVLAHVAGLSSPLGWASPCCICWPGVLLASFSRSSLMDALFPAGHAG